MGDFLLILSMGTTIGYWVFFLYKISKSCKNKYATTRNKDVINKRNKFLRTRRFS